MIISPKSVWFDEDSMWVRLNDARVIGVPLAWFPRLLRIRPKINCLKIDSPTPMSFNRNIL